ncbi:hypothetical protein D9M71_198290 [compost metagenome]
MSDYLTQSYADRQAELEAAKAAFFSNGGTITTGQPFEYVPRPASKPTVCAEKQTRQRIRELSYANQRASEEARQAVEDQVRKLAETMTQREACNATGLSYTTLYRIASAAGIKFQPDPRRGKGRREYIDPAVDAELCERLTALRDIGLNRHQVATQLQISSDRLKRLITTYSIDFPKAKTGKKVAHEKAL